MSFPDEILMFPLTSNFSNGEVSPIPTLPSGITTPPAKSPA